MCRAPPLGDAEEREAREEAQRVAMMAAEAARARDEAKHRGRRRQRSKERRLARDQEMKALRPGGVTGGAWPE